MTSTEDQREPLLWVTSTSGWEEEALISRLLPPAAPVSTFDELPEHPNLVVVTRETQPSCEVLMREFGVVYDEGMVRQNAPEGWTIAATILIATAPGKQDKEFRNYATALAADDPHRIVIRIPFIRSWRLSRIADLPRWDFTPTTQGRGIRRRSDGLPVSVADDFHRLMHHVMTLTQAGNVSDPHSGPADRDQQCT